MQQQQQKQVPEGNQVIRVSIHALIGGLTESRCGHVLLRVVLGPAFSGNFTAIQLLQLGCVVAVSPFPWWLHKRSRAGFACVPLYTCIVDR